MNKTELIAAIAARTDTSKTQATAMLNGLLEIIQERLVHEDTVQLIGFGSFSVTKRAARDGRNPSTGETIKIPAKKIVRFKAGKALTDAANAPKKSAKKAKPKKS